MRKRTRTTSRLSSASSLLKGSEYQGQRIARVTKGGGTRRVLHFTTGKRKSLHRREIHELAKLRGLQVYKQKYGLSTSTEKRAMVRKSTKRQKAIMRNQLAFLGGQLKDTPKAHKKALQAHIRSLKRAKFGSPLVGKRPATSFVSRRAWEHGTIARAGGR